MAENIPQRIGACAVCVLIGFVFWPAFILAGMSAIALIQDLKDSPRIPRDANSTKTRTSKSRDEGSREVVAPTSPRLTKTSQNVRRSNERTNSSLQELPTDLEAGRVDLVYSSRVPLPQAEPSDAVKLGSGPSEVRTLAEGLEIPHLVHFTRCDNLQSILQYGLCSVYSCIPQRIQAIRNDTMRLDGQLDGISLSITFPNYRMFYKYRQLDLSADWAVLILSPKILWEKECGFYRHNAADSRMINRPREKMITAQAFGEMFDIPDVSRERWLRPYDPSDPQAEVMVYETIEPEFIETVAFETKAISGKWAQVLGGIDSIVGGQGSGLFGSRSKLRTN